MSSGRSVLSASRSAQPRAAAPLCAPTRPARGISGFWTRQVMEASLCQVFPTRGGSPHGGSEQDTLDNPMRLPPQRVHEQRLPPHRPEPFVLGPEAFKRSLECLWQTSSVPGVGLGRHGQSTSYVKHPGSICFFGESDSCESDSLKGNPNFINENLLESSPLSEVQLLSSWIGREACAAGSFWSARETRRWSWDVHVFCKATSRRRPRERRNREESQRHGSSPGSSAHCKSAETVRDTHVLMQVFHTRESNPHAKNRTLFRDCAGRPLRDRGSVREGGHAANSSAQVFGTRTSSGRASGFPLVSGIFTLFETKNFARSWAKQEPLLPEKLTAKRHTTRAALVF